MRGTLIRKSHKLWIAVTDSGDSYPIYASDQQTLSTKHHNTKITFDLIQVCNWIPNTGPDVKMYAKIYTDK
jgi:hypothetical protein